MRHQASAVAATERLPAEAKSFRLFRHTLTQARQPTPAERTALANPEAATFWSAIGGARFSQARRVPNRAIRIVVVPGRTGIAIVRVTSDDQLQFFSSSYEDARVGQLAGLTRACSSWAPNDSDCAAPDGGLITMYQLAPDGIDSVKVGKMRVPVVDNVVAAEIGPLTTLPLVTSSFDASIQDWTALAKRQDAKAKAEQKRATANKKKKKASARK